MKRLHLHFGTILVVGLLNFGGSCKSPFTAKKKSDAPTTSAVKDDPTAALSNDRAVQISAFQLPNGVSLQTIATPEAEGVISLGNAAVVMSSNEDNVDGFVELQLKVAKDALTVLGGTPDLVVIMFETAAGTLSYVDAAHCQVTMNADGDYVFGVRAPFAEGTKVWAAEAQSNAVTQNAASVQTTEPPTAPIDAGSVIVPPNGNAPGVTVDPGAPLTISLFATPYVGGVLHVGWSALSGDIAHDARFLRLKVFPSASVPGNYKTFTAFTAADPSVALTAPGYSYINLASGSYKACGYFVDDVTALDLNPPPTLPTIDPTPSDTTMPDAAPGDGDANDVFAGCTNDVMVAAGSPGTGTAVAGGGATIGGGTIGGDVTTTGGIGATTTAGQGGAPGVGTTIGGVTSLGSTGASTTTGLGSNPPSLNSMTTGI